MNSQGFTIKQCRICKADKVFNSPMLLSRGICSTCLYDVNKYTDEILDLINHYNDLTTSDMQGIVEVLVEKILSENRYEK